MEMGTRSLEWEKAVTVWAYRFARISRRGSFYVLDENKQYETNKYIF